MGHIGILHLFDLFGESCEKLKCRHMLIYIRSFAMDSKLEMKLVKTFRHTYILTYEYIQTNPSLESAIS